MCWPGAPGGPSEAEPGWRRAAAERSGAALTWTRARSGFGLRTSSGRQAKCSSGPPKSKAGRRVVGVPDAIIQTLRDHLSVYARDEPGALVFPGVKGGPLRRGNFNKMSAWPHAVEAIGMKGLHFHDLRHTGNQFAAHSGAGLRDLMAPHGSR